MKTIASQFDNHSSSPPCVHTVVLAKAAANNSSPKVERLSLAQKRPKTGRKPAYDFIGIAG